MRFLSNAHIVVLDGDARHRALVCTELVELGLVQVVAVASVKEARQLATERPIDLCIVDPRALSDGAKSAATKVVQNPFQVEGTPAILLAADTSVATLEAAAATGYRAVVGLPVVPRVLYRRVGSILQKARRSNRSAR
jgi:CheY-like chemotaxis protein